MPKFVVLIFSLIIAYNLQSQTNFSTNDSIHIFYDSFFKVLKSDYYLRDQIDWPALEKETYKNLAQYPDFSNSLSESTLVLDKIKSNHSTLFYKDTAYFVPHKGFEMDDFSEQWLKKYSSNPAFEVKLIDNQYGYILLPGLAYDDVSPKSIHAIAQPMYDEIAKLKTTHKPKGWIIDLRFNNGGHVFTMLLSLYDFLGDQVVYGSMDNNKNLFLKTRLHKGNYYDNDDMVSYITPKGKNMTNTKVAIITGKVTASSGEITAMAFKGRKNTKFIGEKSVGLTTTNDKRDLPYGAYMTLSIGFDVDRNGISYEKIIPDISVIKQDNFDNLLLDQNILEAIKFISIK